MIVRAIVHDKPPLGDDGGELLSDDGAEVETQRIVDARHRASESHSAVEVGLAELIG